MIRKDHLPYYSLLLIFFINLSSSFAQQKRVVGDTLILYSDLKKALVNPSEVYKLKLKKKRYEQVPAEVLKNFPNLIYLDLSHNELKELSSEIGNLSNLEYLNLSHNNLSNLPKEIGKLKKLKKFILNNNDIVSLPAETGDLENLEYLDLWSNELGYFPDELAKLKLNLKTVDLRGILIDEDQQKKLSRLLPDTKIHFSPGCNCGK